MRKYKFLFSKLSLEHEICARSDTTNATAYCRDCCSVVLRCFSHCYRPQRSCGQGYVFTRVYDFVNRRGVCLSACWDTTPPPFWEQTTPPRADNPWEQTPPRSRHPPGSRLRDTVNERPVRILLECILVLLKLKFLLLRVDERCSEKSFYCFFTVLREELQYQTNITVHHY